MDAGRVVEFGAPYDLLRQQGPFTALVDAAGKDNSAQLRAAAELSRNKEVTKTGERVNEN